MTNFGTMLHMADFKIEGLDKVLAKMQGLAPKILKKGLRSAGTKAMRIVRDDARRMAKSFDDPESGSNIAKNIVTRYDARGSKRVGGAVIKVGVAGGARPKKGREDTGHWRLVEFGREGVPARPFMRPALAGNIDAVTTAYVAALDSEIDKALK